MRLRALLLLLAASFLLAAPVLADGTSDELLIGFTGLDYEDPDPSATYLDIGDGYKVVGFVTSAGPLIAPWIDFSSYEYTIHTFDLTVTGRTAFGSFLTVTFANNARSRYYEDDFPVNGGTAADYGVGAPPNALSPSTFIDGAMQVGGDLDNFTLVYNFSTNQGNYSGDMTLDEGPDLIYVPPGQRGGWVLSGLAGPSPRLGYDHQVDGECRIPGKTPATHRTWGAVKALYR
jgi:hypothetical protein